MELKAMNKFIFIIACMLASSATWAGDWVTITKSEYEKDFAQAKAFYSSDAYSFAITYKSFFGHNAQTPYETDYGSHLKDGKSIFSRIPGQLTVQDMGVRCVIDSIEKVLILSEPDYTYDWNIEDVVYETTMSYAKIERKTEGNVKTYRISYPSEFPYEKTEIELNTQGLIASITTFYRELQPLDPEVENSPQDKIKFRIELTQYTNEIRRTNFQKLEYYIQKKDKSYVPSNAFSGYKIKDTRIKK